MAGTTQQPLPSLPPLGALPPPGLAGQPQTGPVSHLFPRIGPPPPGSSGAAGAGSGFPSSHATRGRAARDPAKARVTAADSPLASGPLSGGQLAALIFLFAAATLTAGAARVRVRRRG